ncbi:MAG: Protein-export rane protein SecF [Amycolatopsis sp.]|uniref:protein translocase subunit SecF n=1 Tax=Amycolatopsis sp. TaxID=37632 RepID=UPI002635298A|nr:protein translocase subunit SecF [Amycolatopsis sp.]MCU1680153.1 Protein-export rane protein SecF [Amycolatopsis sp.]
MSSSTETFAPGTQKHYRRFGRLYHGLTTVDFVGRRRVWFTVSIVIIVLGLGSLVIRGFNLGIDFKGGSSWEVLAPNSSISQMTNAVKGAGLSNPTVEKLGSDTYQVTADINNLSGAAQSAVTTKVVKAMAGAAHTSDFQVSTSSVGPTWGGQITNKAIEALVVFFIAVVAYISIRFEPKMAAAAFIAMVHDLLVTVGVYSLFGFQITPDTVIAILTILGYSLYDTVVVFDRVRDNTQGVLKSGELTYSDMVNLSMNQTLARSINTSLVAILPVLAVLLIGADLLGATTLQNYGVALFVGLMSGAYSSIFIASPLLAWMKEREPRYRDLAARVTTRSDRRVLTATSAALAGAQMGVAGAARPQRLGSSSAAIQARARKRKRR